MIVGLVFAKNQSTDNPIVIVFVLAVHPDVDLLYLFLYTGVYFQITLSSLFYLFMVLFSLWVDMLCMVDHRMSSAPLPRCFDFYSLVDCTLCTFVIDVGKRIVLATIWLLLTI